MNQQKKQNPIPWNPATMPVSHALDAAQALRTLFDMELQDRSDEEIVGNLRQVMQQWQREKRGQSN